MNQEVENDNRCIIVGAGPAGLAAAYELSQTSVSPIVLEKDDEIGGIARTVKYSGYRFDIGGHRFFTKSTLIDEWWKNILGADFLKRPRMSRIFYNGTFFEYPLKPSNALSGLGVFESARIALSYIKYRFFPIENENTFEQWVCNRFGRRLYEVFFKSYTEKVWGMKCSEIGADWAAQRIKNLDLASALRNMLFGNSGNDVTSLIEEFHYPRLGPGMMWERTAQILSERGVRIRLGQQVVKIHLQNSRFSAVTILDQRGNKVRLEAENLISSMPLRQFIEALDPPAPKEIAIAARRLRYRDFLTVGLIVNRARLFDDNWIYVHSPDVKVGRIQNYKNWSMDMVGDPQTTSLGLEYFVQEGDELWCASDAHLIDLAKKECAELGLVDQRDVVDGVVIRMPKAYPVYDKLYRDAVFEIRSYLSTIENLECIGRNGQHRYNNQDHSMLTGIFAARNILGHAIDVWDINVEAEYLEETEQRTGVSAGERLVPLPAEGDPLSVVRRAFAQYDPVAFGGALSITAVWTLLFATVLALLSTEDATFNLSLLGIYVIGYQQTFFGILIGAIELGVFGFLVGFALASAINFIIRWHARRLFRRLEIITALKTSSEES